MRGRTRPLMAVAALAMALAGAGALIVAHSGKAAQGDAPYVIEVDEQGFNQRQCNINRDDSVVFKNVGKTEIEVISPGFGGLPPDPDFLLQPGESSPALLYSAGGNYHYLDANRTTHTVTVSTPSRANFGTVSCSKEAPTPTPTPTRTPGPTPVPLSPKCVARAYLLGAIPGNEGCAIALSLASDGG